MVKQRRRLAMLALSCLLLAACGGASTPISTATESTTPDTQASSGASETTSTTSTAPATASTTTAAPTTTTEADDAAEFEQIIVDKTEEYTDVIDDLFGQEIDSSLPADERAQSILAFVGTNILLNTSEGQCLVDAVAGLPESGLTELETIDELPSTETLAVVGEATRSCGVLEPIAINFRAGMVDSGGTEEWVDLPCAATRLGHDDGTALFTVTGNSTALELPDYVDPQNTFVLYFAAVGPCLNYGQVTQTASPIALAQTSIECVDEWGKTESRVLRLFAGDMGQDEFGGALEMCLTADELAAIGW